MVRGENKITLIQQSFADRFQFQVKYIIKMKSVIILPWSPVRSEFGCDYYSSCG